jgi:hypothetical protein
VRDLGLLHGGATLAALALGVVFLRARRHRPPLARLAAAALPYLLTTLCWHWLVAVAVLPYGGPWSAARLAPSMSLWFGCRLYDPPGRGAVLGWIYPPIAPIAYLPATLFADPRAAVLCGRCLSLVFYYTPAAWLIGASLPGRDSSARWTRVLLLACFALLTSQSRALSYCSTEVHADAPALGLGAAALGLVARGRRFDWPAAVLATLAVWSKQLTVLVFALPPLWVLARAGWRGAARFAFAWAGAGVGISMAIVAVFGADPLYFNILLVPSRHPWRVTHPLGIGWIFLNMQLDHILLLALVVSGLVVWLARSDRGDAAHAAAGGSSAWPLLLLVGFCGLPLAVLGDIKVGGYDNNFSFALYFLALGGFVLWGRIAAGEFGEARAAIAAWQLVVALGLVLATVANERLVLELARGIPPGRDAQAAVRYLREHRGLAYFPWHPLEHLAVDGQAYHFEYGIYDRRLARFPISSPQFLRHVPPSARLICYPEGITVANLITLEYAGGKWRRAVAPELPGWVCFEREVPAPAFPALDKALAAKSDY